MNGDTLALPLALVAVLLAAILVVLCFICAVVQKDTNESITGLQAVYDQLRQDPSS